MKKALAMLLCMAMLLTNAPRVFAEEDTPEAEVAQLDPAAEAEAYEEPEAPAETETPAETGEAAEEREEDAGTEAEAEEGEENEAEEPVRVRFLCTPAETVVSVYAGDTPVSPEADGSYLLTPGFYTYDAMCDGFETLLNVGFTVSTGEAGEMHIPVYLAEVLQTTTLNLGTITPLIIPALRPDATRDTPTVFFQTDSRWADTIYYYSDGGSASTIASAGCGLLALVNAVYYLNGTFIDPAFLADYAAANGFHVEGGTAWGLYAKYCEDYGAESGILYGGELQSIDELKEKLQADYAAICSVPGHIMAMVDYDPELKRFLLLDSAPDSFRATEDGYVWISEEEIQAMPSVLAEDGGMSGQYILLQAASTLRVKGLLDGRERETLADYGLFDVWINGKIVAEAQNAFRGSYPVGVEYRIDKIRPVGMHRFLGVDAGELEGTIPSGTADLTLSFDSYDFVELHGDAEDEAPQTESKLWSDLAVGPGLELPKIG